MTTLIAVLLSGFAMLLLGRHSHWRREAADTAVAGQRALYAYVGSLLAASRRSSQSVIEAVAARLCALEPSIDVVLFFVPSAGELTCSRVFGPRAQHFGGVRLRRDDERVPAAAAANCGCRAVSGKGARFVVPTDRVALAVPLLDEGAVCGVFYASSAVARRFGCDDALVGAIELAAQPYALALEREADRVEATYDGLTGALAARAFRATLHERLARPGAGAAAVVSLWFVDTDRFKCVNDSVGHAAGDGVLRAMVGLLRGHAGEPDAIVARNGGDEFCVMLEGVAKSEAIERARRFCAGVREHDFAVPVAITASVGVAAFPHDASTSSALLEAADAAMYHSKRTGRDRVSYALDGGRFEALSD